MLDDHTAGDPGTTQPGTAGLASALDGEDAELAAQDDEQAPSALDVELPGTDEADRPAPRPSETAAAGPAPVRVTGHGSESNSWSRISSSTLPADNDLTLEGEGFEQDGDGGERRALTLVFTILGALLLLGAGAAAGLVALRYFGG